MRKEHAENFSKEVENYRKALLSCARSCDWATFEAKAGRLFDYVETVEFRELDRKFSSIFSSILGVLVIAIVGLLSLDFEVNQNLLRFKNFFIVSALGGTSFELYFFLNYRTYVQNKSVYYKKRRELFIRSIEQDFRSYAQGRDPGAEQAGHNVSGSCVQLTTGDNRATFKIESGSLIQKRR
jgi:hypothetical protein